jgi:hypothetical protein
MTEQQWLACGDPERMLAWLGDRFDERDARLFAAACCRRLGALLPDEAGRQAVEVAERRADGLASAQEWNAARAAVRRAVQQRRTQRPSGAPERATALAERAAWAAGATRAGRAAGGVRRGLEGRGGGARRGAGAAGG